MTSRSRKTAPPRGAVPSPRPPGVPFLVPATPLPREKPHSALVLWHLLSLDAPTIAATWTAFFAWAAGVSIRWFDPVAMFLAVWILYAADRLLDAKPLFTSPSATDLEERHRFHHRHRRKFFPVITGTILPLLFLLHRSDPAILHLYLLLTGLLAVWLLAVHARPAPSASSHRLPKELAVGIFFPAAVFIPTVARAPALRLALLPSALLFAALCSLNCLFLYAWEHPRGRSRAHATTRWAIRHLKALALTVTLLGDALYLVAATLPRTAGSAGWLQMPHASVPLLACSLSGAFLLILHARRRFLAPLTLRALADLVLLTPLPLVALSTLIHTQR